MTLTDQFDMALDGVVERIEDGTRFDDIEDYIEAQPLTRDNRDALWIVLYGALEWQAQFRRWTQNFGQVFD